MNGINDVYSLTAQINAAREGSQATTNLDPENFQLLLAQNFARMLNDLISSGDDNDDNKNDDIFGNLFSNPSTNSLANLTNQSGDSLALQSYLLQNQSSAASII